MDNQSQTPRPTRAAAVVTDIATEKHDCAASLASVLVLWCVELQQLTKCPTLLKLSKSRALRAAAPVFQDVPEKRNCAALLAFVSLLWCTEALPLYVTAMAVPLLAVALRVMVDRSGDGAVRLSAKDAAPAVFKAMFSQAGSGPN